MYTYVFTWDPCSITNIMKHAQRGWEEGQPFVTSLNYSVVMKYQSVQEHHRQIYKRIIVIFVYTNTLTVVYFFVKCDW